MASPMLTWIYQEAKTLIPNLKWLNLYPVYVQNLSLHLEVKPVQSRSEYYWKGHLINNYILVVLPATSWKRSF